MWYDNDECCSDCECCAYDSLIGCYFCELDGYAIDPRDVACRDFMPVY